MSRLNSKLVLKALPVNPDNAGSDKRLFEVVKAVNTLSHGVPGDHLTRAEVDTILRSAEARGARNQLSVEFVK